MQLCIVMRIRGSLGAFIHCIVENRPVTSNWAVVPTAKHQLWDLGAFPDQLRPRSSVNIHLPNIAELEVAHPLGREPGGASPGFCWLDSPPWWPPTSPWPPHKDRSDLYRVKDEMSSGYSLAFSVRANCPAINHDRAVTAASAPMCRKGAVACRTQE